MKPTQYFTASEVARILAVPVNRILGMAKCGRIPCAGRVGADAAARFIFSSSDFDQIKAALQAGFVPRKSGDVMARGVTVADIAARAAAVRRTLSENR